ncbi:hypothetical protein J1N35_022742 [Gossypium stocksii]|uniref:Copia protein n=1 Tax=Gossypium stocksii TaxID=47602 RepID=A0A9D3VHS3_9ROSI|nr:hypothetical protein J1N35_022742 [Gossypium stocksii]
MTQGVCELLWLQEVLEELQLLNENGSTLYCGNKVAISIAQNSVQHNRTKHIEIVRYFIKEKGASRVLSLSYLAFKKQLVDGFTKGFSSKLYHKLI